MKTKVYTLLSLLFLFSVNLFAQTATIKGTVRDLKQSPIQDVKISLYYSNDSTKTIMVVGSDMKGNFLLSKVPDGN